MITAYEAMKRTKNLNVKDEDFILNEIENQILYAVGAGKSYIILAAANIIPEDILLSRDANLQHDFILRITSVLSNCGYNVSPASETTIKVSWNSVTMVRLFSGVKNV